MSRVTLPLCAVRVIAACAREQGDSSKKAQAEAADALHQDRETGSIEVGKLADLVVLERNLFEIPPQEINTVRVTRTLLEGKTMFSRENAEAE